VSHCFLPDPMTMDLLLPAITIKEIMNDRDIIMQEWEKEEKFCFYICSV